jgi:hypothetical protein
VGERLVDESAAPAGRVRIGPCSQVFPGMKVFPHHYPEPVGNAFVLLSNTHIRVYFGVRIRSIAIRGH